MSSGWLWYLVAATGGQAAFALCYWLVLARLSTFAWNRAYLLGSLILSAVLPLVALPAAWAQLLWPSEAAAAAWVLPAWPLGSARPEIALGAGPATRFSWETLVLAAYWLGVAWQVGRTLRSLGWLYRLSRQHPRTRLGRGWLVQLPAPGRPAFSFGSYVFLSPAHTQLSPVEYTQLVQHEQVHGAQYHALDLLLAEVAGWFFWFNGLVFYLRRELRTVHEYLADTVVAQAAGSRVAYGRLLLKLAAGPLPTALAHPFAARQVARRIHMLTHSPSSPMKKLRFLLILPVAALAWVGAAAFGPPAAAATASSDHFTPAKTAQSRIGTITWQGNTFLSAAQLNEALELKAGDPYSKEAVDAKLNYRSDGGDVTSRYMDHGYLFFQITPAAKPRPDGATDLLLTISEGPVLRLNTLTVRGNHKVATADVLALIPLRQGELFSRAKLIQSQHLLAESGLFDPTQVGINPRPNPAASLVDIEYIVIEK